MANGTKVRLNSYFDHTGQKRDNSRFKTRTSDSSVFVKIDDSFSLIKGDAEFFEEVHSSKQQGNFFRH